MPDIRTVTITVDPERIIAHGTEGRTKIYARIPEVGKRDWPVPLWVSNEDSDKMQPGGTYLAQIAMKDGGKFWDWMGFGDPNAVAAEHEAQEQAAATLPAQPSGGGATLPTGPAVNAPYDGARWGNSLTNATNLRIAYPELDADALFDLAAPLAARFYVLTSAQIVGLLEPATSEPAGDDNLPDDWGHGPDPEAQ
jgi:hypothetical protein